MTSFGERDSEAELLRRAQAGDDAAIEELLRRWQPSLESIARSLHRRHARLGFDTHDLVSTTFRRLLRIGPGAIGESSGRSLLARILRSAYVDKVRDEVGRRRRQAEAVRRVQSAAPSEPTIERNPAAVSQHMAPGDWELVLLWKQGLSWIQIGEHLGIPDDTARARWHRLMKRLRERPPSKRRDAEALESKDAGAASPEADPPCDPTEGQDPADDRAA